ncbi:MAG: hypothetical protein IPG35_15310 [Flavobacteriales bacterium]|nr:hypothetical protein [Flavobacteriales bacterium]
MTAWLLRLRLLLFLFLFLQLRAEAQQGVTTFGMQVKPVVPLSFFDPRVEVQDGALSGSVELTGGFGFGMQVRHGFTRMLSLETGIHQIRRSYRWELLNDTVDIAGSGRIRYVGYEVPVLLLVYIRLGQRTWMNTALGASLDMYPSDAINNTDDARAYLFRRNWLQVGAVGNIGFEYRTERSGYFYFGATYHRAFDDMAVAELTYFDANSVGRALLTGLSGSYLTVDLRYFFHEDPQRRAERRQRRGKGN